MTEKHRGKMRRFMVHLVNERHSPKDAAKLLASARAILEEGDLVVRDTRVSTKYIEYDISMPRGADERTYLDKLKAISPVASFEEVIEKHLPKPEAIELAVKSFNAEKYWNAHEYLEGVWKETSGSEKSVLNGIILVAAAFVHDEKDEPDICISILKRAIEKFEGSSGAYHGIDIGRIRAKVAEIIASGEIRRFAI